MAFCNIFTRMDSTEVTIARLVLGYLRVEGYRSVYKDFLKNCRHLQRYNLTNLTKNKCIPTRFVGLTLEDILTEYFEIYHIVQGRLEATDYYNEHHSKTSLVQQLLYLLNNIQSSVCSTPCLGSPAAYSHLDETSPYNIQSDGEEPILQKIPRRRSKSDNSTTFDSIPSSTERNDASEVLAQTLVEKKEFHEKIAHNKIAEKQCMVSSELDKTLETVVEETEADPKFGKILKDIIGYSNRIIDSNKAVETSSSTSSFAQNVTEDTENRMKKSTKNTDREANNTNIIYLDNETIDEQNNETIHSIIENFKMSTETQTQQTKNLAKSEAAVSASVLHPKPVTAASVLQKPIFAKSQIKLSIDPEYINLYGNQEPTLKEKRLKTINIFKNIDKVATKIIKPRNGRFIKIKPIPNLTNSRKPRKSDPPKKTMNAKKENISIKDLNDSDDTKLNIFCSQSFEEYLHVIFDDSCKMEKTFDSYNTTKLQNKFVAKLFIDEINCEVDITLKYTDLHTLIEEPNMNDMHSNKLDATNIFDNKKQPEEMCTVCDETKNTNKTNLIHEAESEKLDGQSVICQQELTSKEIVDKETQEESQKITNKKVNEINVELNTFCSQSFEEEYLHVIFNDSCKIEKTFDNYNTTELQNKFVAKLFIDEINCEVDITLKHTDLYTLIEEPNLNDLQNNKLDATNIFDNKKQHEEMCTVCDETKNTNKTNLIHEAESEKLDDQSVTCQQELTSKEIVDKETQEESQKITNKKVNEINVELNTFCSQSFEEEYLHVIFNDSCKIEKTFDSYNTTKLQNKFVAKIFIDEINCDVDITLKYTDLYTLIEEPNMNDMQSNKLNATNIFDNKKQHEEMCTVCDETKNTNKTNLIYEVESEKLDARSIITCQQEFTSKEIVDKETQEEPQKITNKKVNEINVELNTFCSQSFEEEYLHVIFDDSCKIEKTFDGYNTTELQNKFVAKLFIDEINCEVDIILEYTDFHTLIEEPNMKDMQNNKLDAINIFDTKRQSEEKCTVYNETKITNKTDLIHESESGKLDARSITCQQKLSSKEIVDKETQEESQKITNKKVNETNVELNTFCTQSFEEEYLHVIFDDSCETEKTFDTYDTTELQKILIAQLFIDEINREVDIALEYTELYTLIEEPNLNDLQNTKLDATNIFDNKRQPEEKCTVCGETKSTNKTNLIHETESEKLDAQSVTCQQELTNKEILNKETQEKPEKITNIKVNEINVELNTFCTQSFEEEYLHVIFDDSCKTEKTFDSYETTELHKIFVALLFIDEINCEVDITLEYTDFYTLIEEPTMNDLQNNKLDATNIFGNKRQYEEKCTVYDETKITKKTDLIDESESEKLDAQSVTCQQELTSKEIVNKETQEEPEKINNKKRKVEKETEGKIVAKARETQETIAPYSTTSTTLEESNIDEDLMITGRDKNGTLNGSQSSKSTTKRKTRTEEHVQKEAKYKSLLKDLNVDFFLNYIHGK